MFQLTTNTGSSVVFKFIANKIREQTTGLRVQRLEWCLYRYFFARPRQRQSFYLRAQPTRIRLTQFQRENPEPRSLAEIFPDLKRWAMSLYDREALDCFSNPSSKKWRTNKLNAWVLFQHNFNMCSWILRTNIHSLLIRNRISLLWSPSSANWHHQNTTTSRARRTDRQTFQGIIGNSPHSSGTCDEIAPWRIVVWPTNDEIFYRVRLLNTWKT